jgi:aldehyde:ferredoxin oxidoreductase
VPRPVDRFSEAGKGDIVAFNQDVAALQDSAVLCSFPGSYGWVDNDLLGRFLAAATGYAGLADPERLMRLGARVFTLERLFNLREGLGRKDDYLPRRLIEEPLAGGPADGQFYHDYDGMLDEYYAARGWDRDGRPSREKLRELGL